jgi:tRNA modification GTPase
MLEHGTDDTIVAVSTPPGNGGIGIIRLSGRKALPIARRIFRPKKRGSSEYPERQAVFGELYDSRRKETLDEAFLIFFKSPRSYTRQDVVEISLHGSPAVLEEAIKMAVKAGARPARSGEFTLRAFLSGRIDFLQAEAVNDLIQASTLEGARLASRQARGGLTEKVGRLREALIELLADVEASFEFPDDGLAVPAETIRHRLAALVPWLERLVESYEAGKALGEGVTVAIVGRTNVGKSTLFNALLDEPRAIVAARGGTTRDFLREKTAIKNSIFNLVDMAGLGSPDSSIEAEGMRRGRDAAGGADGIMFVFDRSRAESTADLDLAEEFKGKKAILVFNKSDKPAKIAIERVRERRKNAPFVEISARNGDNVPALRELIYEEFSSRRAADEDVILHLRQKMILEEILSGVKKALALFEGELQPELLAEELRRTLPSIGRLTGEVRTDEVLDSIFGRFCIGK